MANSSKFTRSWPRNCIGKGPNGLHPPLWILHYSKMMKEETQHMTSTSLVMNDDRWRHCYEGAFSALSYTILVEWRYGYCWVAHSHAPWNVSQQEWQKHVFFPVENKTKGDVLASSNVFSSRFFTRAMRDAFVNLIIGKHEPSSSSKRALNPNGDRFK